MSKRFFKKEYPYDWWFVFDKKQEYCEDMKIPFYDVDNLIAMSEEQVVDLLNELYEENERLKEYNNKLMKQPLLFDVQTIPNTMEIIEANTNLEKENEQLKQQLNYIQNSISEHIKHQKTELGQKALKEIIEDYNEWLLGHKEL